MRPPSKGRIQGVLFFCAILTVTLCSAFSVARGQSVAGPPASNKRIALVIGNGSYPMSPVGTAVADAKAIAELMKDGGFDVVYAQDTRTADLTSAIQQFSQKLEQGATAIVYYAGHAIQTRDRNFLMPVDATIASDADVRSNAVDADLILDPLIVARPKGAVVILDAARKNPWQQKVSARASGLANVSPIEGITQVYPAAPGQIVEDAKGPVDLFASEFIKAAKVPDRSLQGGISFNSGRGSKGKPQHRAALGSVAQHGGVCRDGARRADGNCIAQLGPVDAVQEGFWDTIKNSDNAANFQAYLDAYPNGPFAAGRGNILNA